MAYQSEIEKLEQRFKEKPEQWFAAVADAYRKAGDVDRALEVLDAWIEARPNYTSGHIVRARCHMDKGADPEASAAFQRVLELDPENIIAVRSLGEIAERQGERGVARQWIERLLEIDPMNEEGQASLARLSAPAPAPAAEEAAAPEAAGLAGFEPTAVEAEEPQAPAEAAPLPSTVQETAVSFGDLLPAGESQEEAVEPAMAATVQEPSGDVDARPPAETAEEPPALDDLPIERASEAGSEATLEVQPIRVGEEDAGVPAEAETAAGAEWPGAAGTAEAEAPAVDLEFTIEGAEEAAAREPAAPAVPSADGEEVLEGLQSLGGLEPGAEVEAEVVADDLGAVSFDEELAWDAGERTSRSISQADIQAAELAHEEALDVPAHALPGIESEEVPEVGAAEAEVPPTEGLMGIDTVPGGRGAAPSRKEAEEEEKVEEEAEAALPLIMPEEVTPATHGAPEEPEPVVTETMADLYVKQGHYREAREIYEQLLRESPGDARLERRLAKIVAMMGSSVVPAPPAKSARYSVATTGGKSARSLFEELAGARKSEPDEPAPAAPGAPAAAAKPSESKPEQPAGRSGFSFDEFFGSEPARKEPAPGAKPTPEPKGRTSKGDSDDDDFRDWLQKLKT